MPKQSNTLAKGETLKVDEFIVSANGKHKLIVQGDNNICLYSNGTPTWATATNNGPGPMSFAMQNDANLCAYDKNGKAIWHSSTWKAGTPNAFLTLTDDGKALISVDGQIKWSQPA